MVISRLQILTAAHCFVNKKLSRITVLTNLDDPIWTTTFSPLRVTYSLPEKDNEDPRKRGYPWYTINEKKIHERYQSWYEFQNPIYDIAIITIYKSDIYGYLEHQKYVPKGISFMSAILQDENYHPSSN